MNRAAIPRFGIRWFLGSADGVPVACAMSDAAALIGMAKPRPWASVETAVLMPMTRPLASSSGPPLLPGLIAASVWSRLVSVTGWPVTSSWTVMVRPVADRMPLVTVSVNVPSGLPIAITVWPTWSDEASPMTAGLSPVVWTLMRARSWSVDCVTMVAGNCSPSASSTVSDWLPATTWRFVRM